MAAARCTPCGISWPIGYGNCPRCGATTSRFTDSDPDPDWRDRLLDPPELPHDSEHARIVGWRCDALVDAGYEILHAAVIAARFQGADAIDLHRACELVQRGCPSAVALEILR